jgi:hypothetical protein
MKYAVEMGSGAMIYIPSFIKIGSGIQKLMGRGDSQTHRQHGDCISLLSLFQNKESRLKTVICLNICATKIIIQALNHLYHFFAST